tara:strand:- start:1272 stop:1619 length:348 start_codon:yes stop_codon:yes gene_type:complete
LISSVSHIIVITSAKKFFFRIASYYLGIPKFVKLKFWQLGYRMIGTFELIIVGGISLFIILMIVRIFTGSSGSNEPAGRGFKSLLDKKVTLTCWHCQKETDANLTQCEHCGQELK